MHSPDQPINVSDAVTGAMTARMHNYPETTPGVLAQLETYQTALDAGIGGSFGKPGGNPKNSTTEP